MKNINSHHIVKIAIPLLMVSSLIGLSVPSVVTVSYYDSMGNLLQTQKVEKYANIEAIDAPDNEFKDYFIGYSNVNKQVMKDESSVAMYNYPYAGNVYEPDNAYIDNGYKSLIRDPSFHDGFRVRKWNNDPNDYLFEKPLKIYSNNDTEPSWHISQWMSEYEINPVTFKNTYITPISFDDEGLKQYQIASGPNKDELSKELTIDTETGEFKMVSYCKNEYIAGSRRSEAYNTDWWVHYIIEQSYEHGEQCYVEDCESIIIDLDYTPVISEMYGTVGDRLDWGQFTLNLSIEDRSAKDADDSRNYMWFEIKLFDVKFPHIKKDLFICLETGSGVFLYSLASETLFDSGVLPIVGERTHIQLDVRDLILEAFDLGQSRGSMKHCQRSNMTIASMNLGFEIESHRNIGFEMHNMGIYYK